MRPMIREDVFHTVLDDGVSFLTPDGHVHLSGASIALWFQRLLPYLGGEHTEEELLDGVSVDHRPVLVRVLHALLKVGVIRHTRERPAVPRVDHALRVGPHRYLRRVRDGAAEALARYRDTRTLLLAPASDLPELVRAGFASGLGHVVAAATGTTPLTDTSWASSRPDHEGLRFESSDALVRDPGRLLELVSDHELVVSLADDDTWAMATERWCARRGVPLAQAVRTGNEYWILPLRERPGSSAPGWGDLRLRAGIAETARGAGNTEDPVAWSLQSEGRRAAADVLAAHQLVHQAFVGVTGVVDPRADRDCVRVDRGDLSATVVHCLPHPRARPALPPSDGELLVRVKEWERGRPLADDELLGRARACFDEWAGFVALDETTWTQTPLNVCEARIGNGRTTDPVTFLGTGTDPLRARAAAARRALAEHAVRNLDPRLLVDAAGASPPVAGTASGPRPVEEHATAGGYVRGVSLGGDRHVVRLPVTVLATRIGHACGTDWNDACGTALAEHVHTLATHEPGPHATPAALVDPEEVELEEEGEFALDVLRGLGEVPRIYDLTGPLGVARFAFCEGSRTVAWSAALDPARALTDGLRECLLRRQAMVHGAPRPLPEPPQLPIRLQGARRGPMPEATDLDQVATRLRGRGRLAVAIPLDHDPALAEAVPYLVKVVLCDE